MKGYFGIQSKLLLALLASTAVLGGLSKDVTFSQSDLGFSRERGYDVIKLKGCPCTTHEIGAPQLPIKNYTFVIPQDEKVSKVSILGANFENIEGKYRIYPIQYPIPLDEENPPWVEPDPIIYGSNAPYPGKVAEIIDDGYQSGFHLVTIRVYPIQYIPSEKSLGIYTNISFQLELTLAPNNTTPIYRRSRLSQTAIEKTIRSLVENPEDVVSKKGGVGIVIEGPPKDGKLRIKDLPSLEGTPVDYVIITSDDLVDEFQRLADWRTKTGVVTVVKSTSWVNQYYQGCDPQEKIRNFIKDAYTYWGSIWFLLGGDVNIIPPRETIMERDTLITDLYFSGLDGNWNANGNSIFGEYRDIDLTSVIFVDERNGWAAGSGGGIIHTKDGGENWSLQENELSHDRYGPPLLSVDFVDIIQGWVVGYFGSILHTANGGVTWENQSFCDSQHLYGVDFVNSQKGWVVGRDGTILYTDDGGISWNHQTNPVYGNLYDVCFVDEENGWAVGSSGTVIHTTDGNAWDRQNAPVYYTLTSVCFIDKNNGWAVGNDAIIHTSDGGENWEIQSTELYYGNVNSVSFVDTLVGWIVGNNGLILHTTDGGIHWTQQEIDVRGASLSSVFSASTEKCWTVGQDNLVVLTKNGGLSWEEHRIVPPDDVDFYSDVFLGRASVENVEEADVFISKILKYEKDPETEYLKRMLLMGGSAGGNEDGMGPRYMEELQGLDWFKEANLSEWLLELYGPQCDPHYPPEEARWDGDAELTHDNAMTAINEGYHIIIHFDHSNPYALGTGVMTSGGDIWRTDMDNLKNGEKYPILWTAGCSPNDFEFDCVTEHFMNKEKGGGVAVIGNTTHGLWGDYFLYWKLLEAVFTDGLYNIGKAFNITRHIDLEYINCYRAMNTNLLGDPYMPIWTDVPETLFAYFPDTVLVGPQEFTVRVTDCEDMPVESAMVCLQKGYEAYTFGFTDDSGEAAFYYIPETSFEVIDLTVTAHNFIPYEGECTVLPIPEPYICYSSHSVDDNNANASRGNSDGVINPGETVELEIKLKNTGTRDATSVTALIKTEDRYAEIIDSIEDFGDISIGEEKAGFYVFRVLPSRPHVNSNILFNLNICEGRWEDNFKLPVYSDSLEYTGHGVIYKKVYKLHLPSLEITNYGFGAGDSFVATLRSRSSDITIVDSICEFGQIQGRSPITSVDEMIFRPHICEPWPFTLIIRDRFGREWEKDILLYYKQPPIYPPDSVWLSPLGQDFIDINWSGCDDAMGYNIYRSSSEYGTYERCNSMIVRGSSVFHDDGLYPYTDYYYKIDAVDIYGNRSSQSKAFCIKTNPPYQEGWPRDIGLIEINGSCPVTGDVDGDGDEEVVICSHNKVYVWDYQGNPLNSNWPIELPGVTSSSPALADMDGDKRPDIVVTQGSNVYVWKEDGALLFTLTAGVPCLVSPVIADLDRDGYYDILTAGGDSVYAWSSKNQQPLPGWPVHVYADDIWSAPSVGDIDNNGDIEVVIGVHEKKYEVGRVYSINHDGSFFWAEPYIILTTGWMVASSPVLVDLDGDNSLEIIFGTVGGYPNIYILTSEGEDFPGWPVDLGCYYGGVFTSPAIGDFNGDGSLDMVVAVNESWDYGRLFTYDNQGDTLLCINLDGCSGPVIADINEDGISDIIVSSTSGGEIYAFTENKTVVSGFPINPEVRGYNHSTPVVSDLDKDGDIEIISSFTDGYMYVWDMPQKYVPRCIEWGMRGHDRCRTGNYGTQIPEILLSITDDATARNSQRKLGVASKEDLHLVYHTDRSCYYTSSDNEGKRWAARLHLGEGYFPTLAIDGKGEVSFSWINEIGNFGCGLYYTDDLGTTIDTLLELVGTSSNDMYIFTPSAMIIDGRNQVHVVIGVSRPSLGETAIKYRRYPVGNSDEGIPWEIVCSWSETYDSVGSPSIDVDEECIPHIVFERMSVSSESHLYYSKRSDAGWETLRAANGRHPFIDCIEGEVHIAYEYERDIWHHVVGGGYTNISNTPGRNSKSPQILEGTACVWSECFDDSKQQDYSDIICRFWNGIEWGDAYNLSNTSCNSRHPQIALKLPEVMLSLAWTEGIPPSYEVKIITVDTIPPSSPQGLSADWQHLGEDNAEISLKWDPNPEPDISCYNIYRSGSSNGPFKNIGLVEALGTPVFVDSVNAWEHYSYYIIACDILNKESYPSDTLRDVSGPSPSVHTFSIYPSPARDEFNIKFGVPKDEKASLEIYDITGRKVRVLVDDIVKAGYRVIRICVKELPSGIYFLRFVSGNFEETKKIVLVR